MTFPINESGKSRSGGWEEGGFLLPIKINSKGIKDLKIKQTLRLNCKRKTVWQHTVVKSVGNGARLSGFGT